MKISRKRKVSFIILLILIGYTSFHLTANYFDWKIDALNINPNIDQPTKEYTHSIYYDYPSTSPDVPHITYANDTFYGLPLFSLTITYSYNDILAEGMPLYLTACGSLYPEGQQTIERVDVGYQGATFADSSFRNYPPLFTAELLSADSYTVMSPPSGETLVLPIKWNTQGDYCPYAAIFYKNGSAPTTIDLQDGKVHVFGLDAVEQMEYNERQEEHNRRNMAITVDLGLIAVLVPLAVVVLKVGSKENQGVTKGKKITQKSKTYQEIQRKKSSAKKRVKKKR